MARLRLDHVTVHLPVLGVRGHSLKHKLLATATGGRIGRESGVAVVEALNDIHFDLRDGDRLGIMGHGPTRVGSPRRGCGCPGGRPRRLGHPPPRWAMSHA